MSALLGGIACVAIFGTVAYSVCQYMNANYNTFTAINHNIDEKNTTRTQTEKHIESALRAHNITEEQARILNRRLNEL